MSGRDGMSLGVAGLEPLHDVHWNLTPAALYEHAVRGLEGTIAEGGPFCAVTVPHTGRSPLDKYVVREPGSQDAIWWGKVNQPLEIAQYERLHHDVVRYLNGQELFARDLFVGADPTYRESVRFITPSAWHTLFVYNMFLRPKPGDLEQFRPTFQVLHAPNFQADPTVHGTTSGTFIVVNFARKTVLIGGTRYAG
jgi:phosphoenolpyruvate carboxykinase (ATP)